MTILNERKYRSGVSIKLALKLNGNNSSKTHSSPTQHQYYTLVLILFTSTFFVLRNMLNVNNSDFYGDQAWFFLSAKDSVSFATFPLLGITSSITWLHQGAVWTYFLIPALKFSYFHPLSPFVITAGINIFCPLLIYLLVSRVFSKKGGILAGLLVSSLPFFVYNATLTYHTSIILLFLTISFNLLILKKYFLSGIFIGLAYQLHLLTFVYWPIFVVYCLFRKETPKLLIAGFLIGILPFLITGPIQTFGVFGWVLKNLAHITRNSSGISDAYKIVFSLYLVVITSLLTARLPKKILVLGIMLVLTYALVRPKYSVSVPYAERLSITDKLASKGATSNSVIMVIGNGGEFKSSSMPYTYLLWWKGYRNHNVDTYFINEMTQEVSRQLTE